MAMTPARRLRAGDADRDLVLQVLQDAHVAGRLTVEELLERQERALRCVYTDELPPIADDLPEWRASGASLAPRTASVPVASGDPGAWTATVLSGRDVTPAAGTSGLRNVAFMGGDNIRLTDAMGPGVVVVLEFYAVMGGHTVFVPPGVRVVDETQAVMGGNTIKPKAQGDGSNGTVVLRGFSVMGGHTVKPA